MKTVSVDFLVQGSVRITAEIPDDLSAAEFEKGLNEGKYLVSISPTAPVLKVDSDFEHIGTVIELDEVNCEYEQYEVKDSNGDEEEQTRRDEKNGLYPDKIDIAN